MLKVVPQQHVYCAKFLKNSTLFNTSIVLFLNLTHVCHSNTPNLSKTARQFLVRRYSNMLAVRHTTPTSQSISSSVREMNSTALNEDVSHREKGSMSGTTRSRSWNTKWAAVCPWKTTGRFKKSLQKQITPSRKVKKAFKGFFVALMFVLFVTICSLPTILYFSVLVSAFIQ